MRLSSVPKSTESSIPASPLEPDKNGDSQIQLWIYRLLFGRGLYKAFVREKDFNDDQVARALGFGPIVDHAAGAPEFDQQGIIAKLREDWIAAEQDAARNPVFSHYRKAVRSLGERFRFTDIECDFLELRLACEQKILRTVLTSCGPVTTSLLVDILASCLGQDERTIRAALAPDGALVKSGVVVLRVGRGHSFVEAFDVLGCLEEEIHLEHADPIAYFRSRIVRVAPAALTAEHFPHLELDVDVLTRYLVDAEARRSTGVNVLIHGEPGTGKTEFARMIAARLDVDLYEVAAARRDGSVLDADDRFRAYRLGQALLGESSGSLILFDEIEDVFRETDRSLGTGGNRSQRKAWVVKQLESNPVPSFWIGNNIGAIDRAFLRRFDYVLEMNAPPRSVRSRVLDDYLVDVPVSSSWKRMMAGHESLVPAVVERAAKVVRAVRNDVAPEEIERSLSRVLGNTLDAMGLPRKPREGTTPGPGYRLDVLNTDCDMDEVKAGLANHRQGRVCLYGPPGTGKTAFGGYIAEALDRPLMARRASDIISPWLGMTERNLARMFRQAQEDDVVLLLDEADSFLQDRQGAQRSWEISEVNEMLTQMESFEGIFIASTNLMGSLDVASLRRFDLKIRFDYLRPEQAWALFLDTAEGLGLAVDPKLAPILARLTCLAPGDFANVVRQARLRCIPDAGALLDRLAGECAAKPGMRKSPMGFRV